MGDTRDAIPPVAPLIDRPGIISAWDDPKFVAAIEKTGRKNLIMALKVNPPLDPLSLQSAIRKTFATYGLSVILCKNPEPNERIY